MNLRSVLIHLRFPFSFFLAPIALLGLRISPQIDLFNALILLVIIHGFTYTASNAFNSFYDKDSGPIGGIAVPPPVSPGLLWVSLGVEAAGIALAWLVSPWASLIVLVYGLMSKAYSWERTRWKRFPVFSLAGICLFQGALVVFLFAWFGTGPAYRPELLKSPLLWTAMATAMCFLAGVYPITQIYQHDEDAKRGDLTYSRLVGVGGTFLHGAIAFGLAGLGFGILAVLHRPFPGALWSLGFLALGMAPCLVFFVRWWISSARNPARADFRHTMVMNILASGGLNAVFVLSFILGIW